MSASQDARGTSAVHVAPETLVAAMEPEMQRYLQAVMQAVNDAPDDGLDRQGASVTAGVREMTCRENQSAFSFDKAAENLARTAQIQLSGEQLRLVVEAEGRCVQVVQQAAALATAWTAADCVVLENGRKVPGKTRVYTGCDGVMVPIVTPAEKAKRRAKVKEIGLLSPR